jgi:peptidoglycan/LPS O-acetylase OafA/YrhL
MTSTEASANLNRVDAAAGRYRPDIDGLRAIAVLPVVFYHYQVWPFSGGYVGVDVFFVISGYLITTLIHAEMAQGRFSILNFYERRARRILPALFAVMAVASVAALVLLFPRDLVRYAKSVLAAAGFVSNFQFWSESGYFGAASATKPLLHTWSLAVEEQFYLVFPWLLYGLRRFGDRTLFWGLAAVLVVSLLLSVVGVVYWPVTTFYLLPARFWELLLGGLLALGVIRVPENAIVRNVLAAAGLAAIGWGVFALTPESPFPGANAIAPCLGTAAVIAAGSGGSTIVNRGLALRWLVLVGLISYSLYLWHWPLYVFARVLVPEGLSAAQTGLLIAASVALAILSWRYVEQPFRLRTVTRTRRSLFAAAGAAIAVSAVVGTVMWGGEGLPGRYGPDVRAILAAAVDAEPLEKTCFGISPDRVAAGDLCKIGADHVAPSFLLWGDSHADALLPAVAQAAKTHGQAGLFAGRGRCPPLAGVTRPDTRECRPFNDAVLKIALAPRIKLVILDARWTMDAGGAPLGIEDSGRAVLVDAQSKTQSPVETFAVFARGLDRTVKVLTAAKKEVVIVEAVPEFRVLVPQALARMALTGHRRRIAPARADYLARDADVRRVFGELAKRYPIRFVHPDAILCPSGRCKAVVDGHPLYRDEHHLTVFGAELLTPLFVPLFAQPDRRS